ncbi:MAG: hypothetical protein BVN35_17660 [Proteobacteria bacterium ST_bin11]|nr:MAG: hypothetical protein BVN35_17660 [Proteobacteria bacterium ST_bin11]
MERTIVTYAGVPRAIAIQQSIVPALAQPVVFALLTFATIHQECAGIQRATVISKNVVMAYPRAVPPTLSRRSATSVEIKPMIAMFQRRALE